MAPSSPQEDILALELIALVEARMSPRAVLLQARIDKCLAYLEQVTAPNMNTIAHIRHYLTGRYDTFPSAVNPSSEEPTR